MARQNQRSAVETTAQMSSVKFANALLVPAITAQIAFAPEPQLTNIRQFTRGGRNAEAYFCPDGSDQHLVSTGTGATMCSYFLPDAGEILDVSTSATDEACLPRPDKSKGYAWTIYNAYEIDATNGDESNLRTLFAGPGCDAEATVSARGDRIVFRSSKDGDVELYAMNLDWSDVRHVTYAPGYDGGAFSSRDAREIVYRAHHPTFNLELAEDRRLLAQQLVKPTRMEIFSRDTDGASVRQLALNGAANFASFFRPADSEIIFSWNMNDPDANRPPP